jgi:drug/metabolite transporter (DMT)-like permease
MPLILARAPNDTVGAFDRHHARAQPGPYREGRMTILLGLLAAMSFSLGIALQQRGTMATPASEGDWRFLAEVVRQPIWALGAVMSVLGWVFQTAALATGPLVVVQGLVVCSLVFTVPIGAWLNHARVDHREVGASILTVGGLVLFLVVGHPTEGIDEPSALRWWCAALVALVAVLTLAGTRRRGSGAAAMLGSGAGLAFGFQAAVSKMFANELGHGVVGLLTSWSTWVLIASVATGFAVQQAALKAGSLAAAVSTTNTTTLLTSVVLGVFLFEEHFTHGAGHLVVAALGLVLTIAGIGSLAGFVGATKGSESTSTSRET